MEIDAEDKIQLYIIKGLITFNDYTEKYIEYLSKEYFTGDVGLVFDGIRKFYLQKNVIPTTPILIDIVFPKVIKDEDTREACNEILLEAASVVINKDNFYDWLCEETEKFISLQAIIQSLMKATELVQQGKTKEAGELVQQAAALEFNDDLGLDYFADAEKRLALLNKKEEVLDSGIPTLNSFIGGGWRRQTLNVIGAPTNVGKTMILCSFAHYLISKGYNVLYITLEIRDDLLANRIDANLTNISIGELQSNSNSLLDIIRKKKERKETLGKPLGRLIIKDYKSEDIRSNQIKALIRDLQIKKKFNPDAIIVDSIDYIVPNGKSYSDNTYGKLKTASRELRNVMCLFNCVGFSAVQVGRQAFSSSVIELEDTSDSIGIPQTADFMMMVSRTEDMAIEKKLCCHIAKNRYGKNKESFFVNVDYEHMRIEDASAVADDKDFDVKSAIKNLNSKGDTNGKTQETKKSVNI